jgi:uridylate kinase
VDGVDASEPAKNPDAIRADRIGFQDALVNQVKVMDAAAFSLCRENGTPIIVFDLSVENNIERVVMGEPIGTWVGE